MPPPEAAPFEAVGQAPLPTQTLLVQMKPGLHWALPLQVHWPLPLHVPLWHWVPLAQRCWVWAPSLHTPAV